jgi:hypothetical protein
MDDLSVVAGHDGIPQDPDLALTGSMTWCRTGARGDGRGVFDQEVSARRHATLIVWSYLRSAFRGTPDHLRQGNATRLASAGFDSV